MSLARVVKYKGLSTKDLKCDLELIRNVVAWHGLESLKWRAVNPLALRFTHRVVDQLYQAIKYHLEQSDTLQTELSDIIVPDVTAWYPGMLERLSEIAKQTKDVSVTKMTTRKSKEVVAETPAATTTKD